MNMYAMRHGQKETFGADSNVLAIWKDRIDYNTLVAASNQKMTYNKDGSADVYFGPTPPKDKNANWIKTVPARGYFAAIRLYSPTEAFFKQEWRPDNIQRLDHK